MKGTTAVPAIAEELESAEGLLESDNQSDQRMLRKVPLTLTLLLVFAVAALTLGHQSKGVVANVMSKVGLAGASSPADFLTAGARKIATKGPGISTTVAANGAIGAKDTAGWGPSGDCNKLVESQGNWGWEFLTHKLVESLDIEVPNTPGMYVLCYRADGKEATEQTGQVLRVIAGNALEVDDTDTTWGKDYSELMAGKSRAEIKRLDKIIRYGATDPGTDPMVTWLKGYHEQVGGMLPGSGAELKKLDHAASKMLSGLAKGRGTV